MQKMICVDEYYTSDVNIYLDEGWRVISVTPIIKCVASNYDKTKYGAYVVIEKEE